MPDRNFTFHPYCAPTACKSPLRRHNWKHRRRLEGEDWASGTNHTSGWSPPAGGRRIFRCITQSTRNIQLIPLFVCQHTSLWIEREEVLVMNGIIYLVGLIVVIMAILSFLGLR